MKVAIGSGDVITALVGVVAAKELGVKVGDQIHVLIKATRVTLGKE